MSTGTKKGKNMGKSEKENDSTRVIATSARKPQKKKLNGLGAHAAKHASIASLSLSSHNCCLSPSLLSVKNSKNVPQKVLSKSRHTNFSTLRKMKAR